ncbi:MAG: alpha/beta hydrolase, partial [Deltaproteobacteria bacterium]|nr:alpha/beta hydrolase [Deltaproteobacteria bacterium]
ATARRLAEDGWYALSLDLRGHGESDWHPQADYTMDAFVGDLLSIAAALAQPPALVGASLGGITSLLAAGEGVASAFKAIVLVDIAPRMEAEGVQRIVAFMRAHLDGFATLDEAADAITEYMPSRRRPKDLTGLNKNLRHDNDGRYRWHWDPDFVLGGKGPDASRQPDRLQAAARGLKIPALLVRGQMSEVISEEGAREFLAAAPHAKYVDVSNAGHMVAGDRNDVFAQAVIDFLRSVRGA